MYVSFPTPWLEIQNITQVLIQNQNQNILGPHYLFLSKLSEY